MRWSIALPMAALIAALPAPALARAGSFVLVNRTNVNLSDLAIRRYGTQEWKGLALAPASGAQGPVEFDDPDCAFDIRASAGGNQLVWSGVNLCEAKIVTLRRNEKSGALWVDYE